MAHAQALTKFNGHWKIEDKDPANSEKYLKKLGIGLVKRLVVNSNRDQVSIQYSNRVPT